MKQLKSFRSPFSVAKPGRDRIQIYQLLGGWAKLLMGLFFMSLRQVPARIFGVSRSLEETTQKAEPNFMEMGRALEYLYSAVIALTKHVKDITLKLSGSADENLLGRAEELAEEAGEILEKYRKQTATSLAPVKTLIEHLETLFLACDQIDRIATNLRVVGINIGVESTRSTDAQGMFSIVSEEIIKFSDAIVSVGDEIREDVSSAKIQEEQTLNKISAGLLEFRRLSDEATAAILSSVAEIDECVGVAKDVFDESGMRFEEISEQVGEIVATVQFHDSMRQRVEHMTSALVDVGRRIIEKQNGIGLAGGRVSTMAAAYHVANLQTGQLQDIIEEIERVHLQGVDAFQNMEEEVVLLARSMASVCNHANQGAMQDPFSRLVTSLKHLMSLVERADKLVGMIEESIARGAAITTRFSSYLDKVEKISVETHIKAINAIIKSDHLGERGRTLEVLAQEMNTISKTTDEFVLSVKNKINHIGEFAETVQHRTNMKYEPSDQPDSGQAAPARILSEGIQEVVLVQNLIRDQLNAATRDAERLVSDIRRSLEGLAFLPTLAGEMLLHSGQLEAAVQPLHPFAVYGGGLSGTETNKLIDLYTMQRERDVHETLFTEDSDMETEEAVSFSETRPDEVKSAQQAQLTALNGPNDGDGSVQMSDDETSFGDNVELF